MVIICFCDIIMSNDSNKYIITLMHICSVHTSVIEREFDCGLYTINCEIFVYGNIHVLNVHVN